MKKNKLTESYLHNILMKVIKEGIEDDGLHDDLNLTGMSLDNTNNFADDEEDEDNEQYIHQLAEEAIELADKLYYKLEEMCDECRNINEPSFDEYELKDLCDSAEGVMNGLGEMFGDAEIYGE